MASLIELLRRKRSLLLKAYLVHVGWFASTCAFAATETSSAGLSTSLWMVLLTVPPVLYYTAAVHKACKAVDPQAATVGWGPIILFTIFLTPLESGLVLPAKNLLVSRRVLRQWDRTGTVGARPPGLQPAGRPGA